MSAVVLASAILSFMIATLVVAVPWYKCRTPPYEAPFCPPDPGYRRSVQRGRVVSFCVWMTIAAVLGGMAMRM